MTYEVVTLENGRHTEKFNSFDDAARAYVSIIAECGDWPYLEGAEFWVINDNGTRQLISD